MNHLSEKSRTKLPEKHMLYGLIALLCLAPLPFGSDRQAPFAIILMFIGAMSIYWGLFAARDRAFVRISLRHVRLVAIIMAAVFSWAIFQIIPFNIEGITNDFWSSAQKLLPQENIKASISVNPQESWMGFFRILAYAVLFWLALQICRSGNNSRKIIAAVSLSGVAYATYGLMLKALGAHKILWYDKIYYTESLTSTFINRNNYATYAGIALVVSIAIFLNKLFENLGNVKRRDLVRIITQRIFVESLSSLIMIIMITAALILSTSRAGISSSVLGIICLILLSASASHIKKYRKIFLALSGLIIILFALMFGSSGDTVAGRFNNISKDSNLRLSVYNVTSSAIADFPLNGTGLGSFPDVFKAYRDAGMIGQPDAQTGHAHNSYLELMLELGVPVAILVFLVFAIIWGRCLYGAWSRRQNGYIPALAASAAFLVAFHSLFDFSAQIPAVAIIFIILLAAGFAQSYSRQVDLSDASRDIIVSSVYHKASTKSAIVLGAVLILAGIWQFSAYFIQPNQSSYNDIAVEKIELAKAEGVLTAKGKDLLLSAQDDLKLRLGMSPIDSFSWAYLAYATLLSSDDRRDALPFLVNSIANGFYEPRLLFFRIKLMPILWSSATDEEKAMFGSQIKMAWRGDSRRTMKILGGRLAQGILKEQLYSIADSEKALERFNSLEKETAR